ncbi:MAG TPA: histidine kinase [Kineosporiaceae bacterium]
MNIRAVRRIAIDGLLLAVAGLDAYFLLEPGDPPAMTAAVVACLAVAARRRFPRVAFAASLPAFVANSATYACLIALYTVAARARDRRLVVACAAVVGICAIQPWRPSELEFSSKAYFLLSFAYATTVAAAPAILGQLVQARRDLSQRLEEILRTREHERELLAQAILAKERAQLAREMHDVVSHQVSLIAVQAGALQVSADSGETAQAASTIRRLSVNTLEELRQMVLVLRASGSQPTELTPQPTLSDLQRLVTGSGIEAQLVGDTALDVSVATQRAIYRTVQEALTNVRKHAPGARATIELWRDATTIGVTITNTPPTRPSVPLPSARHGLIGLRERAQLLGGTVEAGLMPNGGYQLRLRLPLTSP